MHGCGHLGVDLHLLAGDDFDAIGIFGQDPKRQGADDEYSCRHVGVAVKHHADKGEQRDQIAHISQHHIVEQIANPQNVLVDPADKGC